MVSPPVLKIQCYLWVDLKNSFISLLVYECILLGISHGAYVEERGQYVMVGSPSTHIKSQAWLSASANPQLGEECRHRWIAAVAANLAKINSKLQVQREALFQWI